MTYTAFALRDTDTVVPVTVLHIHRTPSAQRVTGYDVRDEHGRKWFTMGVWDTVEDAARVAADIAHDLDL